MKTAKLGDYLLWEGQLAKVIGTVEFNRVLIIEQQESCKCESCGHDLGKRQFPVVETSPLFQENAAPVTTISNPTP